MSQGVHIGFLNQLSVFLFLRHHGAVLVVYQIEKAGNCFSLFTSQINSSGALQGPSYREGPC